MLTMGRMWKRKKSRLNKLPNLFVVAIALGLLGCELPQYEANINIPTEQQKLIVSLDANDRNKSVENKVLEVTQELEVYALLWDRVKYENTTASWTLEGDIGDLLVLSGGKGARFRATKSGVGSVRVQSGDRSTLIRIEVAANAIPVAATDLFYLLQNSTEQLVSVLDNDSDADNDPITLVSFEYSGSGNLESLGEGRFRYTPAVDFFGRDSFRYTITDGKADPVSTEVELWVITPSTWTGRGSDSLWTNPQNWCGEIIEGQCSGNRIPLSSELAVFSSLCENCEVHINQNIVVAGLHLTNGFSGSVSQMPGINLELGSLGLQQFAGNFLGGDGSLISDGNIDLRGGSFRSTSGILRLRKFDIGLKVSATASFLHNSGSLVLEPDTTTSCSTRYIDIDAAQDITLHSLRVRMGDNGCNGLRQAQVRNNGTGRVRIDGDFVIEGGYFLGGNYDISNNLALGCANSTYCARGGSAKFSFIAPKDQWIDHAVGADAAHLVVNKPSHSIGFTHNARNIGLFSLDVQSGHFQGLTTEIYFNQTTRAEVTHSGGSLDLSQTHLNFNSGVYYSSCGQAPAKIESSLGPLIIQQLSSDRVDAGCNGIMDFPIVIGAQGIHVTELLRIKAGYLTGGKVEIHGNAEFLCASAADCALNSSSELHFRGGQPQSLLVQSGAKISSAGFRIQNNSQLSLLAPLEFAGPSSGQNLYLESGSLDLNGHDFIGIDGFFEGSGTSLLRSTENFIYNSCLSGSCTP